MLEYLARADGILAVGAAGKAKLHKYFRKHAKEARSFTTDAFLPWLRAAAYDERDRRRRNGVAAVRPLLGKFDALLSRQDFVLGRSMTLADFLFATEVDQLKLMDPTVFEGYPNIARYLLKLERDGPHYKISFDEAAVAVRAATR
ncbi:hypothetical protein DIPPA_20347 [Diplonema papillatum]|nr:hypothetical protein DIPPA_20347 [Diplonema papillatum]